MRKVTLDVIAREFNVSKNTVSKALRGQPGVSDELREKIVSYSISSGYAKNNAVSKEIINITLICRKSFFEDVTFWSNVFNGILDYEGEDDLRIKTVTMDKNKESETISATIALNSDCAGYIVVGDVYNDTLRLIKSTNLPVVVVDYYCDDIDCDYINSANRNGIYKALKFLHAYNHKKIGFINNVEMAYSFKKRYEAYIEYMNFFNLSIDEKFIWHDAVYIDTKYYVDKLEKHRSFSGFPTAWICVNDNTALAFCHALSRVNIRVPEDASVVGFDNISSYLMPFLTTIAVPQKSMGQRAVKQLLYRIKNTEEPFENILLNTKLIERNSVKFL